MATGTVIAKGVTKSYLNEEFFTEVAKHIGLQLESWSEGRGNEGGYHMTEDSLNAKGRDDRLSGVFKYTITGKDNKGNQRSFPLAVRCKLNNHDNSSGFIAFFEPFGKNIHEMAKKFWRDTLNFRRASELEVLAARRAMKDPHLARFLPNVYHTVLEREREHFIVVTDFIATEQTLVGGNLEINTWSEEQCFRVIKELAVLQSRYLENTQDIEKDFGGALTRHHRVQLQCRPWYRKSYKIGAKEFPHLYTSRRVEIIEKYLDNMESIAKEYEEYPMTFCHNDSHAGNLWLRKDPADGKSDLILYDWELCCINVPQTGLPEFMAFTLKPQSTPSEQLREWMRYVHYYQDQVLNCIIGREEGLVEKIRNRALFERMFYLQVMQVLVNRLYIVAAVPEPLRPSGFSILMENTLLFIEGQEDEFDKQA